MSYDIENLVKSSISTYNNNQKKFFEKLKEQYNETEIKEIKYDFKRQLDANFRVFMDDELKKKQAINRLRLENYSKKKHQDIANDFLINKGDIEKFYINYFFNEIYQSSDVKILEENILKFIKDNYFDNEKKFNYLKSVLSKIISLFSPYILKGGNNQNFALLEIGVNNSNQGDGAEHIFVAKAMIAGFNASKVDVGSSDYDAIIEDKSGNLLKVQVKSFSDNAFSRKGRDRGGEGIDASNRSNIGKLVTSENCDILVAVNKKNSELFIFSKNEIDDLPINSINRKDYMKNWENWSKINE